MYVLPFLQEDFINKAFAESRISFAYLDILRLQSLNDFKQILKPEITYVGTECLILISDESMAILQNQKWIPLSSVEQIGWYSEDSHLINERLMRNLDPKRFENLHQQNPQLKFSNFELLRDPQMILKQVNVFTGGIGLCYHHFRQDYDALFSRMEIQTDSWLLPRSLINTNVDIPILTQLLLLVPGSTKSIGKTLFSDTPSANIVQTLLCSCSDFFLSQAFSVPAFFNKLDEDLTKLPETREVADSFRSLYDGYVKKGLAGYDKDRLSSAIRIFLDLAKNDVPELQSLLQKRPDVSKTSLFLLGMMHRADHLEKQFEFGNFIPSLVELFCTSIGSITITPDDLVFTFRKSAIHDSHIRKVQFLNQYVLALKKREELSEDIELLEKNSTRRLRQSEMRLLERDIHNLNSEVTARDFALQMESQNRRLQDTMVQRDQQISLLQRDIAALHGDKAEVLKELNNKNDDILKLQETVQRQSADIEDKRKEIESLQSEIARNRTTINDLSSELGQREITIRQLENEIHSLSASLSDNKTRLFDLLDQHKQLLQKDFSRKHWVLRRIKPKEFQRRLTEFLSVRTEPYHDKVV